MESKIGSQLKALELMDTSLSTWAVQRLSRYLLSS